MESISHLTVKLPHHNVSKYKIGGVLLILNHVSLKVLLRSVTRSIKPPSSQEKPPVPLEEETLTELHPELILGHSATENGMNLDALTPLLATPARPHPCTSSASHWAPPQMDSAHQLTWKLPTCHYWFPTSPASQTGATWGPTSLRSSTKHTAVAMSFFLSAVRSNRPLWAWNGDGQKFFLSLGQKLACKIIRFHPLPQAQDSQHSLTTLREKEKSITLWMRTSSEYQQLDTPLQHTAGQKGTSRKPHYSVFRYIDIYIYTHAQ